MAWGPCDVDHQFDGSQGVDRWELVGGCSEKDREALAVPAHDILQAFEAGHGVELEGVVVQGDLFLDRLPLQSVTLDRIPHPVVREALTREDTKEVRIIHGPFILRDVLVEGTVATNLIGSGFFFMKGRVSMSGTKFEQSLDLSRTVFFGPVDFSEAVIAHEGFFIKAMFTRPARFEKTAFGTHSRFHRAVFSEEATFTRAGFNGLAEFLEVTFEEETGFSRTRFNMGTGFSGSRFKGILDFSEATFEQAAYFRFTEFVEDAYFRRTVFKSEADFTQAKFGGVSDFTKVLFEVPPHFEGVTPSSGQPPLKGLQDPTIQIGIVVLVAAFIVLVFYMARKT